MFRRALYFQERFTISYFKIKTNLKFVCLKKKKIQERLTTYKTRTYVSIRNELYYRKKLHWSRSI